jgi:hypothetical protein
MKNPQQEIAARMKKPTGKPLEGITSWFGQLKQEPKKLKEIDLQALSMWTQNDDGSITGFISDSKEFRTGTKITTSPVRSTGKAGTVVTTVSGSRYRLGLVANKGQEAIGGEKDSSRQPKPFSLFNGPQPSKGGGSKPESKSGNLSGFFGGNQKVGEEDVAVISNWKQNADGSITGVVRNKEGLKDGTRITTSSVNEVAKSGNVVKTAYGSKYKLR